MRERLTGERAVLFVDNGAACAALMEGAAKNKGALLLVYALWAIAAQRDIGLWTERAPTEATPAGLPSRDRDLSFETELTRELVAPRDIFSIYDFSWAALQRAERVYCGLKRKMYISRSGSSYHEFARFQAKRGDSS